MQTIPMLACGVSVHHRRTWSDVVGGGGVFFTGAWERRFLPAWGAGHDGDTLGGVFEGGGLTNQSQGELPLLGTQCSMKSLTTRSEFSSDTILCSQQNQLERRFWYPCEHRTLPLRRGGLS